MKFKWIFLKLVVFIVLLLLAISIKLLREIISGVLCCLDYITTLGEENIDGKIMGIIETLKKIGHDLYK